MLHLTYNDNTSTHQAILPPISTHHSISTPLISFLTLTLSLLFHSQGDALVDAAIEAYAADRDVTEFLDTLQILSSHTPEGTYVHACVIT